VVTTVAQSLTTSSTTVDDVTISDIVTIATTDCPVTSTATNGSLVLV